MTRALLALAAALALAPALAAQEPETLRLHGPGLDATRKRPVVRIVPTIGNGRPGGWGFVSLRIANPDAEPHTIEARVRAWNSSSVEATNAVRLAAGESARLFLPVPGEGAALNFEVDGRAHEGNQTMIFPYRRSGPAVLFVGADLDVDRLGFVLEQISQGRPPRGSGSRGPHAGPCPPEDLPDRWTCLAGFDLVVLVAAAEGLDDARQRALADALAAGGNLLVLRPKRLGPGSLRAALGPGGGPRVAAGRHGFGFWCTAAFGEREGLAAVASDPAGQAKLRAFLSDPAHGGAFALDGRSYGGPLHDALYLPLDIPGLGELPVRLFFVLILGFAVLVGPVNYLWLKRRRRRMLLLVTVPALGFGFTAVILAYGLFSEGFGIKGAVRSVTFLDQRTRESVTVAGRTLYAGLSPSRLTPSADTYVCCPDLETSERNSFLARADPRAFRLDFGASRLDGAILPSRTPTTFFTATARRERARLRLRRRPDGDLELLHGPGLAPVDEDGAVVVRDFDGTYYESRRDGLLRRVEQPRAGEPTLPVTAWTLTEPFLALGGRRPHGFAIGYPLAAWLDRVGALPPGAYWARVRAAPGLDTLGLEVEERAGAHLVAGRFAPEDVVE